MTEIPSRLSAALADRYQIEDHLGEGGMATVYLAEDLKHRRNIRDYTQSILAAHEAEGLSGNALQVEIDSMNELEAQYANLLFRLPMTFLEIFPVGLVVALGAAAVLRNSKVLPAHG